MTGQGHNSSTLNTSSWSSRPDEMAALGLASVSGWSGTKEPRKFERAVLPRHFLAVVQGTTAGFRAGWAHVMWHLAGFRSSSHEASWNQ